MGGNAFPNLTLSRIKREDIPPTVEFVVNNLALPEFSMEYAMTALMGSCGKKPDSGDIDFAANTHMPKFFGEPDWPVFDKHVILERLRRVIPQTHISTHTFKMGNLMTAFPINGNKANGLVQVDFVFGKKDLLQFTHFSPSSDVSRFAGVFLQQGFGVLCKLNKFYEEFDPNNGERIARVGWHLSLEHGLFCKWESRRRIGMGCSKTTPEEFETRFAKAPRFPRIGIVDDPATIVHMLLGYNVPVSEVNSFEKLVAKVKQKFPDRFDEFRERFIATVKTSGMMKRASPEQVKCDPVWDL